MTEEQSQNLAREAGAAMNRQGDVAWIPSDIPSFITRFANLVAASEKQCDGCGKTGADGWALYCVKCSEAVKQASVDFLPHDDHLRFIQRVLESDAPQPDRDAAAQMAREIRRSIRPQEKP
jgi:hypothetical protein